jgi:hypothetical protein
MLCFDDTVLDFDKHVMIMIRFAFDGGGSALRSMSRPDESCAYVRALVNLESLLL